MNAWAETAQRSVRARVEDFMIVAIVAVVGAAAVQLIRSKL
jgi:hypothetical protein